MPGKLVPKAEIQGDRYGNRRPHTCRDGNRKNSIPMGVPSPVAVRLENTGVCSYRKKRHFSYIADPFFPLLSGSSYRGAITGKSQMGWIHQSVLNRTIQELVAIEPENKGKKDFPVSAANDQQRRSLEAVLEESQGVLSPFLFPLGGFILGNRSLGER